MVFTLCRRALALGVFALSAWCLYVYGLGHVASERITKADAKLDAVVVPGYLSAEALGVLAEQGLSTVKPETLSMRALSQDPTNGRAAAYLMSVFIAESRDSEVAVMADLAGRLWPAHAYTHSRLADYWIAEGRMDKLVQELGLLMVREPSLRKDFFPLVEELAVSSGEIDLLDSFIQSPPNWWSDFFYKLSLSQPVSRLIEIYERRERSSVTVSTYERKSLVGRLIKEQQWPKAYTYWQSGLEAEQKVLLVNGLYDGGFEGEASNLGFGWSIGRNKSFDIQPRITYGAVGRKALQILFKQGSPRINFRHLSQRVLLGAGRYKLSYRARLDTLKNAKGLVWRLRCLSGGDTVLAESSPMSGRQPWKTDAFEFVVPSTCKMQSISLEAASRFAHEHVFSGQLWLDDIALSSQTGGQ